MAGKRIATVVRARLLAASEDWPSYTLVRAPAGFGKSLLLDQLQAKVSESGQAVVRLNLVEEKLANADLSSLLGTTLEIGKDADYPTLLAALGAYDDVTLLIDNADCLQPYPEAGKLVQRLGGDLDRLRIVMAGRGDFGLSLARYRADGRMIEIGPDDLLFDVEEQQAVLESWSAYRVPARQIDSIASVIAGWPCGFGLQFQALESGTSGKSGRALDGTWRIVADYFQQEVMDTLPEEMRYFLQRASVLEQLTIADCDLLFGDLNSEAMLVQANKLGAPLWPIDPEHHRYAILPLFRRFLRSGLSEEEANRLGAQAADRFEELGRFQDACVQALALGDHARAGQLLELQFKADFAFRDEGELLVLAERIEDKECERHPFVLLALAQALIFRFEFEKARRYLDGVRGMVEQRTDEDDDEERQTLEMLLLHREMLLALGEQELSRAQKFGDKLLRDMDQVPPMQRVMILNSLTYAQQELYIFRAAERYYVQAKKLIPSLDSWVSSVPLETFYARHLFQTGRTTAGVELIEETLARLVEELGPRPILGSIAGIVLAEIKFEMNELVETEQLLADYGGNVEQFGFLPMTLNARVMEARLHMARGDHEKGFAALERPFVAAGELFDKMFRSLTVERIYWLLRLGRNEAAKLACTSIGLSLNNPPEPHSLAASAEESVATAWIQLARANKRIDEAIHVAQKWQRYTDGVGAIRSNVRWNVILASLQTLAEEPSLAMRHLRRAVRLGAGGLYRGAFLAEADVLQDQFAKLLDSDLNETESAFLTSIVSKPEVRRQGHDQAEITVPLGTFSPREEAIVRLVAKGMFNREIGGKLGMTEGTVKWHLRRIYDKLGIRRRSQVAMLVTQWHSRTAEERESSVH